MMRTKPIVFLLATFPLILATTACAQVTATNKSSFEGIEEPTVRYLPGSDSFVSDSYINITDQGSNIIRFLLRYRPGQWWDGDRNTTNEDRQRAEVKGLGAHQKVSQTFEYTTTWRSDANFKTTNHFCHIFQLKATDGDDGAPLVVLSILNGTTAAVRYCSGTQSGFTVVRSFPWTKNAWQTVRVRIKTSSSTSSTGSIQVSVNGGSFQGVSGIKLYRSGSTDYRPKWGLYRGVDASSQLSDNWIEHKNVTAKKL